jgi:hypothetical protein
MGTEKVSYRSAGKEADLDFDARLADDFTLMRPGLGRTADALLGRTFFNGIKWDPQVLADRCK